MIAIGTALVLGATGGIGGEVARSLLARNWRVKALHRDPERIRAGAPTIEWLQGDAMDATAVVSAAAGADVIVHAVNPPGYRNWAGLQLPMLKSTIAAAVASGARVLFPGTVYNFGPDAGELVDEDTPEHPITRKGAIRVAMEQRLRQAAELDGVRTLIVRAGDFFGPRCGNSWFAQGMVPTSGPLKRVFDPGRKGVGHAWAYLPDLAETMVRLLERRDELPDFEVFNFEGSWFEDNSEFAEAIRIAANRPKAAIYGFPWLVTRFMAPFNETCREMQEMRYLWECPLRLDDRKLRSFLGEMPATPLPVAIRSTLQGLGRVGRERAASAGTVPAPAQ